MLKGGRGIYKHNSSIGKVTYLDLETSLEPLFNLKAYTMPHYGFILLNYNHIA